MGTGQVPRTCSERRWGIGLFPDCVGALGLAGEGVALNLSTLGLTPNPPPNVDEG